MTSLTGRRKPGPDGIEVSFPKQSRKRLSKSLRKAPENRDTARFVSGLHRLLCARTNYAPSII